MKQLQALDASIEKWQRVVYKGVRGLDCPLCEYNRPSKNKDKDAICKSCIIGIVTGEENCDSTPFYSTSEWSGIPGIGKIANNLMLSKLYEIRIEYINGYHKGIYE